MSWLARIKFGAIIQFCKPMLYQLDPESDAFRESVDNRITYHNVLQYSFEGLVSVERHVLVVFYKQPHLPTDHPPSCWSVGISSSTPRVAKDSYQEYSGYHEGFSMQPSERKVVTLCAMQKDRGPLSMHSLLSDPYHVLPFFTVRIDRVPSLGLAARKLSWWVSAFPRILSRACREFLFPRERCSRRFVVLVRQSASKPAKTIPLPECTGVYPIADGLLDGGGGVLGLDGGSVGVYSQGDGGYSFSVQYRFLRHNRGGTSRPEASATDFSEVYQMCMVLSSLASVVCGPGAEDWSSVFDKTQYGPGRRIEVPLFPADASSTSWWYPWSVRGEKGEPLPADTARLQKAAAGGLEATPFLAELVMSTLVGFAGEVLSRPQEASTAMWKQHRDLHGTPSAFFFVEASIRATYPEAIPACSSVYLKDLKLRGKQIASTSFPAGVSTLSKRPCVINPKLVADSVPHQISDAAIALANTELHRVLQALPGCRWDRYPRQSDSRTTGPRGMPFIDSKAVTQVQVKQHKQAGGHDVLAFFLPCVGMGSCLCPCDQTVYKQKGEYSDAEIRNRVVRSLRKTIGGERRIKRDGVRKLAGKRLRTYATKLIGAKNVSPPCNHRMEAESILRRFGDKKTLAKTGELCASGAEQFLREVEKNYDVFERRSHYGSKALNSTLYLVIARNPMTLTRPSKKRKAPQRPDLPTTYIFCAGCNTFSPQIQLTSEPFARALFSSCSRPPDFDSSSSREVYTSLQTVR